VETALSVGAGGSAGVLADKAIVRNRLGQLVLPGSHLKGRLRHACEILVRSAGHPVCDAPRAETMCPHRRPLVPAPCPICQLFGSPSYQSVLAFADLLYHEPAPLPTLRPGASINRRRRTVEEQRLFFIETSPPGSLAPFFAEAAIRGRLPDARAGAQAKLLLAGLHLIQNWGSGKSRGLGWGRIDYQARLDDSRVHCDDLAAALGGL
jgi:CRISPR/Cas system CSM-associated protein Csm3 (group 7 of RAMP superfamily)